MIDLFRDLYETLLKGIEEIEKNNPDPKKQIEACFHLSENIRREAEKAIVNVHFANEQEEIHFFRTVKPRFTSIVEFYSILYRAELFIPETSSDQIEFWKDELLRAQIFLTRNAELVNYLNSGDAGNDKKYFLRNSPEEISAVHDELVAKILARQKYIDYINTKIIPHLDTD